MKRRGFTLIELLVAISIISVILVYVFNLFFAGIKFYEKASGRSQETGIAVFIIDKISQDILEADIIIADSDQSQLRIVKDSEEIMYEYKNSKVRRQKGASARYLTIDGEILSLQFNYTGNIIKTTFATDSDIYSFSVHPRSL